MSCFFCGSFAHLPQNCDIHISKRSRQKIAETKNCCNLCFIDLSKNIHDFYICQNNQKCYTCFSKDHHTFFCQNENLLDSNIFLPNIDANLIPLFMQILNLEEQILLTFTSPKAAAMVKPKKLTVRGNNDVDVNYKNQNLLITHTLSLFENVFNIPTYLPPLESLIFKGENLKIFYIKNFCSRKFLQLLTPRLKFLHCIDLTFTENLNFFQILKKAPNLEFIIFDRTNIDINNTWLEEIIQWKNGNNLKKLSITIPNTDFNVESLVTVMKEKCQIYFNITLNISASDNSQKYEIIGNIEKKLLPYFGFSKNKTGFLHITVNNTVCSNYNQCYI